MSLIVEVIYRRRIYIYVHGKFGFWLFVENHLGIERVNTAFEFEMKNDVTPNLCAFEANLDYS